MHKAWLEPICAIVRVGRDAAGKCRAWLETIAAVLRIGKADAKHYDPYHFTSTVRYLSIDEIEVVGLVKRLNEPGITKADWEAIMQCCRDTGIKRILFRRVDLKGRSRERWHDTKLKT